LWCGVPNPGRGVATDTHGASGGTKLVVPGMADVGRIVEMGTGSGM
jgi:hypothetical protein